jgi:hypothetical protein
MSRAPILRHVEPAQQRPQRAKPRAADDEIQLGTVDLLDQHAALERRRHRDRPGERVSAHIEHVVVREPAQRLPRRPEIFVRLRDGGARLIRRAGPRREQVDAPAEPPQIVDDLMDVDVARLSLVRQVEREIGEPSPLDRGRCGHARCFVCRCAIDAHGGECPDSEVRKHSPRPLSELRNRKDTSSIMILVPLLNPKFATVTAAKSCELRVRGTRSFSLSMRCGRR